MPTPTDPPPLVTLTAYRAAHGPAGDDALIAQRLATVTAAVRRRAGWHIAPTVAETVPAAGILPGPGGTDGTLVDLPTLALRGVTELRVDRDPWPVTETLPFGFARVARPIPPRARVRADVEHGLDHADDLAAMIAAAVARSLDNPRGVALTPADVDLVKLYALP